MGFSIDRYTYHKPLNRLKQIIDKSNFVVYINMTRIQGIRLFLQACLAIVWTSTTATAASTATVSTSTSNAIGPFQLRLFQQPRACWQGDCRSLLNWCMQCEGLHCEKGDILWMEPCRRDQPQEQLFYWAPAAPPESTDGLGTEEEEEGIPITSWSKQVTAPNTTVKEQVEEWGQLQMRILKQQQQPVSKEATASTSSAINNALVDYYTLLCLERVELNYYQLQYCDIDQPGQWFRGLQNTTAISLNPNATPTHSTNQIMEKGAPPFELNPPKLNVVVVLPTSASSSSLRPKTIPKLRIAEDTRCLNMHHHPRQYEEVLHTTCERAREVKTNLWETVWTTPDISLSTTVDTTTAGGSVISSAQEATTNEELQEQQALFNTPYDPRTYYQLGAPRRDPHCQPRGTCGMCQGHCLTDDDCAGQLKCFYRTGTNEYQTPPGCFGPGEARTYYCIVIVCVCFIMFFNWLVCGRCRIGVLDTAFIFYLLWNDHLCLAYVYSRY